MLTWPKNRRLLSRSQFSKCYDQGSRRYTRSFVLFLLWRGDENGFRLGITVTRKTGCAVIRNRVKRVLRDVFRRNQHALEGHFDVVVVPKRTLDVKRLTPGGAEKEILPVVQRYREKRLKAEGPEPAGDNKAHA